MALRLSFMICNLGFAAPTLCTQSAVKGPSLSGVPVICGSPEEAGDLGSEDEKET